MNRFAKEIKDSSVPEGVLRKLFVSIFFNVLLDGQDRKGQDKKGQNRKVENVQGACEEALASLSAHMSWNSYYALLNRCFREMKKHTDKRKRLVNLVCSILDKFHFAESGEIRACLEKVLFPKIQKLVDSESDSVNNVNVYIAAVKVLKLLPKEIMVSNIDSVIYQVSQLLRNPMESTRVEARKALVACLKELGLEDYLQLVIRKLVSLLTKGFEVHVLGYTVNYILSKCLPNPTGWKLDHCLEDLLDVVERGLDEQEEDKKDSTKKKKTKKKIETIKRKSLDTLKLIAENVTFRSHALKLLTPVTSQLQGPMTSKLKTTVEDMLKHIAAGIEVNPSVDQGDLFLFIYRLVDKESDLGDQMSSQPSKKRRRSRHIQETAGAKSCPHLITLFALDLLHNRLKRIQPNNTNEELVSKLDPFVKLVAGCLTSVYEDVVTSCVRCFTALLKFQLPSFKSEAGKVTAKVLDIAQSAVSSKGPLVQSCLKLVTALINNDNFKLSSEQLKMVVQFPMIVDLESDSSIASLSVVKAIVKKKLVVPKMHDIYADQVSRLMITNQDKSIRNICGEILVGFLVNYTPSVNRLEGHVNFLLKNLSYEHSTGREAVLDVLQMLIRKFLEPNLDKQSQNLFAALALRLETENDKELLPKICDVVKCLIGCTSNYNSSLELCLGWYKREKSRATAAKVLGLFIEVKERFPKDVCNILLQEAKMILESALMLQNSVEEGSISFWKDAYYTLLMVEKMLKQFPGLCFGEVFEAVWDMVFKLLLHRYEWLQTITCRLLNYYFKRLAESGKQGAGCLLGKPSSLFMVAASLCLQLKLKVKRNANAAAEEDYIRENIVFAISGLHSMIGQSDDEYWSSLDKNEQAEFLDAFLICDSGKVRSTFVGLVSSGSEKKKDDLRKVLIGSLLKRLEKLAFDVDVGCLQMRVVFNVYKGFASNLNQEECRPYAFRILLPLYKVCQGFTGKVVSHELKQLAEEVRDGIRDKILGIPMFVQVYSEIKKSLEAKRDKRKREEKIMAVINPERNAKRKLKLASKNKANKKRRTMSSKMVRWSRS